MNRSERKALLGTTYPLGTSIKTYLIGQLTKNFHDGNRDLITGEMLLELAFQRIRENDKIMPSTVVHIDCQDTPELRKFYEQHGFSLYKKSEYGLLVYLMPTRKILNPEYKR